MSSKQTIAIAVALVALAGLGFAAKKSFTKKERFVITCDKLQAWAPVEGGFAIRFNADGKRELTEASQDNLNKQLPIFVGDAFFGAPKVMEPITREDMQIVTSAENDSAIGNALAACGDKERSIVMPAEGTKSVPPRAADAAKAKAEPIKEKAPEPAPAAEETKPAVPVEKPEAPAEKSDAAKTDTEE
jgi:hypothetical protein